MLAQLRMIAASPALIAASLLALGFSLPVMYGFFIRAGFDDLKPTVLGAMLAVVTTCVTYLIGRRMYRAVQPVWIVLVIGFWGGMASILL